MEFSLFMIYLQFHAFEKFVEGSLNTLSYSSKKREKKKRKQGKKIFINIMEKGVKIGYLYVVNMLAP